MALFDKIRGKNTILEPMEVPKYSAKVSEEDLKIMRHEATIPIEIKTKEDLALELVQSIISSPIPEKPKIVETPVLQKKEIVKPITKKEDSKKFEVKNFDVVKEIKKQENKNSDVPVENVGSNVMIIGSSPSLEVKKEDLSKEEEAKRNVVIVDSIKEEIQTPAHDIILLEERYIPHKVILIEDKHNIIYI